MTPFCRLRFRPVVYALAALFAVVGTAAPAWAQFETRATQAVLGESFDLALGDFNHDGILDVAIPAGDSLYILLGNGDGTFRSLVSYPGDFYSIVAADFNNDGNLDLVVAPDGDTVEVFLGNGDGTFQPPKSYPTTSAAGFIAVGDFNGDHKLDIAIIDSPYISVLLGNGDGTFQPPIDNDSFVGPGWLALGDFNNDHLLDVAAIGSFGSSASIGVLLGNGNGTLQSAITQTLSYPPGSVAAADFNGDGNLDVAVGNYFNDGLTVLLGEGNGSFSRAQTYQGGGGAPVIVGQFSPDGSLDVVATPSSGLGAAEFLGNGNGTFQPAEIYASNHGAPAAAGDLNGDHKLDLVLRGNLPEAITSMLNTGTLGFSPSSPLSFPSQLINTSSPSQAVQLTNTGSAAVSISSIKASGSFQVSDTCGGSVPSGGSCTVSVVFGPKSEGQHSGAVTLVDSASSKPQVVELGGAATVAQVLPGSLKFGQQKVGTESAPQVVTVTNEGSAPVTFSSINIAGTDARDFSQTDSCLSGAIVAGGECSINVTFTPKKSGSRTGTLYINVAGGISPRPVMLAGRGK